MAPFSYRFIIIDKDPFIAHDMMEGLADACPGCEMLHLRSVADLPEDLAGGADRVAVVTKLSLREIEECGLAMKARSQGVEVVVRVGEDPVIEIERHGWLNLPSPFSWDDLTTLVQSLNIPPALHRLA